MWASVGRSITRALVGNKLWPTTALETAGSVTPSDRARSPDLYDVRRAGVVGDGVTDDTAALIRACKAAGPYAAVYVHGSLTCLASASIVDASLAAYAVGQTWHGGGNFTVANGFNFNLFDLSGITDFTVLGLRASSGTLGAAYSAATARFVAAKSLSHRCRVIRCHVTGFQSAVQFNNSTDCEALHNVVVNPYGWGINVQTDADYARVIGNRISGVANEHGIYASGGVANEIKSPLIEGNVVTGSAIDGIKLTRTADARVLANTCESNGGQGVYVTVGVLRSRVAGNHCQASGENGILVYDGTETSDRNTVERNTCRKNDKNGISVSCAGAGVVSRTRVLDNDIEDNDQEATGSQYGVSVSGGANNQRTEVRGNRITDEVAGVSVTAGCANAVIGQNEYENCTTQIVDSAGSTVRHVTSGSTAAVTDGASIAHGHPKTPASVRVTGTQAGEIATAQISGANIVVALKTHAGAVGTSQTVHWEVTG